MDSMRIFCHSCAKYTNQNVLSDVKVHANTDYEDPWTEAHRFTRCAGCDAFTYSIESWSPEVRNQFTGEFDSEWKTFPRGSEERRPIDGHSEFPAKVRLMYNEIIGAINAQLPVLAGIGLRAIIEATCRDQGIQGKNLQELIDGLATKGVLSSAQSDILHTHRFLGNIAAHEITPAQPGELLAALEIAENILRTIYVLPNLSKQVKTGRKLGPI